MEWIKLLDLAPLAMATAYTLGLIFFLASGKLLIPAQIAETVKVQNLRITEANDRASEYRMAWLASEARNDVLVDYLRQLGVTGEVAGYEKGV